ncbi:MAG: exopolysaccharide Pel transporter PelG [Pseudomonadota bacterium]
MAGIGFELRKLLRHDNYLGLLQAYAYAGLISSGPWILSILGVLLLGVLSLSVVIPKFLVTQFQTSVTYLISSSLILTGFLQPGFTRYISDRLFEQRTDRVLPNLNGLLLLAICIGGLFAFLIMFFLFPRQGAVYRLLMVANFVVLSAIWLVTILLSGLKEYKVIVGIFGLGYTITLCAGLLLRPFGLDGLMTGFFIGHFVLLAGMLVVVVRNYPSDRFIEFDFLGRGRIYPSLIWIGFFYNLGIWADKYIFWFLPETSQPIIGPLRASLIYDLPIFLAYLSIIPGMAVFLVRMETDFVEHYDKFYDAVREGGSLSLIRDTRNQMVRTARQGIFDIIKIQSLATLAVFVAGPALLELLHMSGLYLPLLYVDVVAAGLQVVLLGLLNVFFYLDKRKPVLLLTATFVLLNIVLSWLGIRLGPYFFGYGFALALLLTNALGMLLLDRDLDRLEYETFMLQPSGAKDITRSETNGESA